MIMNEIFIKTQYYHFSIKFDPVCKIFLTHLQYKIGNQRPMAEGAVEAWVRRIKAGVVISADYPLWVVELPSAAATSVISLMKTQLSGSNTTIIATARQKFNGMDGNSRLRACKQT